MSRRSGARERLRTGSRAEQDKSRLILYFMMIKWLQKGGDKVDASKSTAPQSKDCVRIVDETNHLFFKAKEGQQQELRSRNQQLRGRNQQKKSRYQCS